MEIKESYLGGGRKMRTLAVIPARGGSKRLPRKNIMSFAGKPLIAWTINEALKVKGIDRLICSTEDEKIAKIALSCGCEVPFIRPRELASDKARTLDVVLHAVRFMRDEMGEKFDTVILLQPTSPLRRAVHISRALALYKKSYAKSLVSVYEPHIPPFWMFRVNKDGRLERFVKGKVSRLRRQEMPKVYCPNGAIYINDIKSLAEGKDFYMPEPVPFFMDARDSLDIDNEIDFKLAEFVKKEKRI